MKGLAFVNNNDNIENYEVSFDEKKLEEIQKNIDSWNGKGNVIESRYTEELFSDKIPMGKKIEVVTKTFICNVHSVEGPVKVYSYRYYEYNQCDLSILCDFIKDSIENPLEFSMALGELYHWDSRSKKENEFTNDLRSLFNYEIINTDANVKSDITVEEKKGILLKIKKAILKSKENKREIMSSEYFADEIDKKADLGIKKNYQEDFEKTKEEYKKVLKRSIVDNIPSIKCI